MHRLKPGHLDKATLACTFFVQLSGDLSDACIVIRDRVPNKPLNVEDVDPASGEQPSIPCEGYTVSYYGAPPLRNLDECVDRSYCSWNKN